MKILLTNDDGIEAPGLWAAAEALRHFAEVCVVAPQQEQSGVGAALTLRSPLDVREVTAEGRLEGDAGDVFPVKAYAVEGTPGDSCILGLEKLVGKVDLVVSGINAGSNVGWDVLVSGTVGAALQGYVRGYPTIAISVGGVRSPLFEGAARLLALLAKRLVDQRVAGNLEGNLLLNVNVPNVPVDQIAGLQVTSLGGRSYGESVREDIGGAGKRFRIDRNVPISADGHEGTDIWALKNNHISVTPLQVLLGSQEQNPKVEDLISGIGAQLAQAND